MAHAEASQSLDGLPRRTARPADTVTTTCTRCDRWLIASPGETSRCLCGRTELRNPVAGGLGPSVVLHPPRPHRRPRRG
jgi:hypothetical protein